MKTELKYKTFDELLNEIAADFTSFNNENMIEPGQLIKVAQRVNYDLGLRIYSTKEKLLDLEHKKVKLPDDFYVLNYAYLCSHHKVVTPVISGRQTEDVILDPSNCLKCGQPDPTCSCNTSYTVECNNGETIFVQVVEKRSYETRVYDVVEELFIGPSTGKVESLHYTRQHQVDPYRHHHKKSGYIKNGFIYTNVEGCQKLWISYQGNLEDKEGNLLVLDHPMINEYYEYALKQRILENLYLNGEDVVQRLQLIEARLKAARNNALSIVNTPDFAEMKQLWEINRKAQYDKFYNMFKDGYGW